MTVIALVMIAVLVSLGVWQLKRRTEKHVLIAALTERLAEPPVPLPPPSEWSRLTPAKDEFRRVQVSAILQPRPDAMIYTSGSSVRSDVSGPGTWAFVPARLLSGENVVINMGFVPNTMQNRAQQDRAVTPLLSGQPVLLTGYLRFPETAGLLSAHEDTGKRLWFVRDIAGMAQALGWDVIAPFYVDLETPVPPSGVPKPGPLDVHLKDDHLQYAITWFGLALAVLGTFGFWVAGRRRSSASL
jgi:cytochrome oxidase assembly protein ShyY1